MVHPRPGRRSRPSGREPVVARSALRLRLPLAVLGLVVSTAVTIVAILWNDPPFDIVVLGSGFALLAVVALIDIIVVLIRLRETEAGSTCATKHSKGQ